MQTVLVLEKTERSMLVLRRILQEIGEDIYISYLSKPIEAMECIENGEVDVLICNYEIGPMSCKELFDYFKMCSPHTRTIAIIDNEKTLSFIRDINHMRVNAIIVKPFEEEEILTLVRNALAESDKRRLRERAVEVRGEEKKNMEQIYQKLQQEAEAVDDTYQLFLRCMKGLLHGTIDRGDLIEDPLVADFLSGLCEVYNQFYFMETGNVWMYFNYFMNLFHGSDPERQLEIHQKIQSEVSHAVLAESFYMLYLIVHAMDTLCHRYHIFIELTEDDSDVIIKFLCDLNASKKEDGTYDLCIEDEEKCKFIHDVTQELFHELADLRLEQKSQNPLMFKIKLKK